MTSRESHEVELVDESGRATGSATVAVAHEAPGQLHRAFSVVLHDGDGRVLLQRRAPQKTRFAGRWANAACGHPAPGIPIQASANQRLIEELGVAPVELHEIGVYLYRAADETTGRVEHEYDHVLLGRVPADLAFRPDPDEVDATRWVPIGDLRTALSTDPTTYAPWLAGVIALVP